MTKRGEKCPSPPPARVSRRRTESTEGRRIVAAPRRDSRAARGSSEGRRRVRGGPRERTRRGENGSCLLFSRPSAPRCAQARRFASARAAASRSFSRPAEVERLTGSCDDFQVQMPSKRSTPRAFFAVKSPSIGHPGDRSDCPPYVSRRCNTSPRTARSAAPPTPRASTRVEDFFRAQHPRLGSTPGAHEAHRTRRSESPGLVHTHTNAVHPRVAARAPSSSHSSRRARRLGRGENPL